MSPIRTIPDARWIDYGREWSKLREKSTNRCGGMSTIDDDKSRWLAEHIFEILKGERSGAEFILQNVTKCKSLENTLSLVP